MDDIFALLKIVGRDITDPVVHRLGSHDILYCNNCDKFKDVSVDQLKTYSLIIVNDSVDQGAGNVEFCDHADKNNLNIVILIGNATCHQQRPQIIYYPYWYHRCRSPGWFSKKIHKKNKKNIDSIEKTHKISCLNGNPRWHRIYNYLLLKTKPYFDEFLFSMHLPVDQDKILELTWNPPYQHVIPQELLQQWNSIKNEFLPKNQMKLYKVRSDADIYHPAYTDSYINLVTETTMDGLFVTEKTWKPIASGQFFLIVGSQHTISYLKDFGVDTFDDIIDHKYYDSEPDWQQRIHKVHEIIEDLLLQDIVALNQHTQQRRLNNADNFFNRDCDTLYQTNFEPYINNLK
jgi:hypothetical protein